MDYYDYTTTNDYQMLMEAMEYNGCLGDLNEVTNLTSQEFGDQDHPLQPSLSHESYSSGPKTTNFNYLNSNNNGASSHVPASSVEEMRAPTTLLKSNSVGSFSSTSEILSFSNNTNDDPQSLYFSTSMNGENQSNDQLKISSQGTNKKRPRANDVMTRAPHIQDHIVAERKRREKLNQGFVTLSALVPGLTKMDKTTILVHAINYMKQMQDRVQILEEQVKERGFQSAAVVLVKKSTTTTTDGDPNNESSNNSSIDEDSNDPRESTNDIALPEIEARILDKDVLIRILCDKQRGLLGKLLSELENFQLNVMNYSIMPFGNHLMVITVIAQIEAESGITANDLVQQVRDTTF